MSGFKRLWQCGSCDEVHDYEYLAEECCQPDINEIYGCIECGAHHDEKNEAIKCCEGACESCQNCRRDYKSRDINAKAIQIAGHCTVCNPLFTLDQRLAIEDMHYLQTGSMGDLRLGAS